MSASREITRIAFVTIGQSPRTDIFPELVELLDYPVSYQEFGAVDDMMDLGAAQVLGDNAGRPVYCSRLRDGTEVVLDKASVAKLIRKCLLKIGPDEFDLAVVLCSGEDGDYSCVCPVMTAGSVIRSLEDDLRACGLDLGIVAPKASAMDKYVRARGYPAASVTYASPYSDENVAAAAARLGSTDIILLHCLGFDQRMGESAEKRSGKPVVTARQLLSKGMNSWLAQYTTLPTAV